MKCKICENTWYVCRNCPHQKRPFETIKFLKRHIYKTHKKESISERSLQLIERVNEIVSEEKLVSEEIRYIDLKFSRVQNNKYFEKDQLADGPTYLVGLSQFHLQDTKNLIPKADVILQMKLAHFSRICRSKKSVK